MNAQRPLEADDKRRVVLEVQTAHAWNRVYQAINAVASHQPESDEDFDQADPKAIAAAVSTIRWYQSKVPDHIPDDVFQMPDGGLMIEWGGDPGGTILRLDFAPGGKSQLVITYADDRAAEFVEFIPYHDFRHPAGRAEMARDDTQEIGTSMFTSQSRTTINWQVMSLNTIWPEATSRKTTTGGNWLRTYSLAS